MPTPAVIEQQVVDISLRKGLNELDRLETLDWTKWLSSVQNAVYDELGGLSKKPGPQSLFTVAAPGAAYRFLNLQDGLASLVPATQGRSPVELWQTRESTDASNRASTYKGSVTEFSVATKTVGSWGSNTDKSAIIGVCSTSRFTIVLYKNNPNTTNGVHTLVFLDPNSGNIVTSYLLERQDQYVRMVVVDDRYLHLYASYGAGAGPTNYEFYQLDTEAAPLNTAPGERFPQVGWTALASATQIVDAVAISGNSVVFQTGGAYQKFNNTGTNVTSGTIAGFTALTGADTDGTNLYVVGYNATPEYVHKKLNSSFAVQSTALLAVAAGTQLRVAVRASDSVCKVLAYFRSGTAPTYRPRVDLYTVNNLGTTFGLQRSFVNWVEQSLPVAYQDRYYVALTKLVGSGSGANASSFETIGQTILVDLSGPVNSYEPVAFRPAASLGLYNNSVTHSDLDYGHFKTAGLIYPHRPAGTSIALLVGTQNLVSAGSIGFQLHTLSYIDGSIGAGTTDVFSGGIPFYTDGTRAQELGWYDTPYIHVVSAGAGTIPAGVHTYVAVYEYKDSLGKSHYSRCSKTASITLAGAENVTVTLTFPSITYRPTYYQPLTINIYRTSAGGTQMNLVSKRDPGITGGSTVTVTYTDSMTDIVLATQPVMYRQPLLSNPALDRYSPLAATHVIRNKDRVFYSYGSTVFYSSFDVDGEATWFNPSFFIPIADGTGDIVALGTMDGVLVVFKKNSVFVIEGDGPPENGGTGTEFSPPRRIQTEFGCIDNRSVVAVPDGIMYRSNRGIELLTRNLAVKFIGELVRATVDSHSYTAASCFDRVSGRVLFLLGTGRTSGLLTGSTIVVYDTGAPAWAVWKGSIKDNTATRDITALAYTDLTIAGVERSTIVYSASTTASRMYYYESPTQYTEEFGISGFATSTYVGLSLETGWVRMDSMQDQLRVSDFLVLAKNSSNHDIKISAAYNYSATYEDSETYYASEWAGVEIKQLSFPVPKQSIQAVRFKVEDLTPTDPGNYPVGTGKGPEILALSVKLGKKGGGAKLSAVSKGVTS